MDELTAPQQNRLLAGLSNLLRRVEQDSGPEFLPRGLDVMGLVRQLALPSAETVEKLSYGDPLFRMPTQSNIPITTDRGYLAEVLGLAPAASAASRATTRLSNEAADALVRQITGRSDATAMRALEEIGQMSPVPQITTYHGSEYGPFARFDPSKASSGSGGQAFGYGAGYTSESEKVGKKYILANTSAEDAKVDGQEFTNYLPEHRASFKVYESGDKESTMKAIEDEIALHQKSKTFPEFARQKIDDLTEELEFLRRNEPLSVSVGYLYKGEIPDEILPQFMDWNLPLKEQPLLKSAIRNISKDFSLPKIDDNEGAGFAYQKLANALGGQENATKMLESKGIRGIRYKDRDPSGEDVSNFVVFDPADYRIQEINDMPIGYYERRGLLAP